MLRTVMLRTPEKSPTALVSWGPCFYAQFFTISVKLPASGARAWRMFWVLRSERSSTYLALAQNQAPPLCAHEAGLPAAGPADTPLRQNIPGLNLALTRENRAPRVGTTTGDFRGITERR